MVVCTENLHHGINLEECFRDTQGLKGEGEIAQVRFVSLSPPNKRSLCRGAPR
jgi:hypothetical protein